jgi:hypothetical protein
MNYKINPLVIACRIISGSSSIISASFSSALLSRITYCSPNFEVAIRFAVPTNSITYLTNVQECVYEQLKWVLGWFLRDNYQSVGIKHSLLRFDRKSLVYLPHLRMHMLAFIMAETLRLPKKPWGCVLACRPRLFSRLTTFLHDLCGCACCRSLLRLLVSRYVHRL